MSKLCKLANFLYISTNYLLGIREDKDLKISDIDFSILTPEERQKVENLINMTNVMFMISSEQDPLSEHDRSTIIKAYIDALINRRKKKIKYKNIAKQFNVNLM